MRELGHDVGPRSCGEDAVAPLRDEDVGPEPVDSWPRVVQSELRQFARDRQWGRFHTPRNLLLALVGEVGELAELYQWLPDSEDAYPDPRRVAEEIADVVIYVLRLADIVGVDIEKAVAAKLASNGRRYPVGEWHGKAGKAGAETGGEPT